MYLVFFFIVIFDFSWNGMISLGQLSLVHIYQNGPWIHLDPFRLDRESCNISKESINKSYKIEGIDGYFTSISSDSFKAKLLDFGLVADLYSGLYVNVFGLITIVYAL